MSSLDSSLPEETVAEVVRLLKNGLSMRIIALSTGISWARVRRIKQQYLD